MLNDTYKRKLEWDTMTIAICDDSQIFLDSMERRIKDYAANKDIELDLYKYSLPSALLNADLSSCDVLFLDIEMPGMNGIDLAKQIRSKYNDLLLVFVTGFIQYAPSGYRVNAFRYLMKTQLDQELWLCLDEVQEKLHENTEHVKIQSNDIEIDVALRDILYFEGTPHRFVLLHFAKKRATVECKGKLADYESQLSDHGFIRLHRSFLVNMRNINNIRNYKAVLVDGTELKVSERQYSNICRNFVLWKGRTL